MKLNQEVPYTHSLGWSQRMQPLKPGVAKKIDRILGESGLSMQLVHGEGRVNLSGLPMEIGNEILERLRQVFKVHIRYNRNAYDAERPPPDRYVAPAPDVSPASPAHAAGTA